MLFFVFMMGATAHAYSVLQAAAPATQEDLFAPPTPDFRTALAPVVKARRISKVRAVRKVRLPGRLAGPWVGGCYLPVPKTKGWEMEVSAIFARVKGKLSFGNGNQYGFGYGYGLNSGLEMDLNTRLGVPDHYVVPSMSIRYRFRPKWAMRYTLMPMEIRGSGDNGGWNNVGYGQGVQVVWQRLYHRVGLVYDAVRTYRARVSVFGDYVRLDERINVLQIGCCGNNFDNDLNMAMAGLEFERCLRTASFCDTLSLECRGGVAFLDEACGGDLMTQLKYSIPLGKGRRGYLAGGYRFVQFKKGYNDFKRIDTSIEGGFVKMGFIF
jgi:hypothetical protein